MTVHRTLRLGWARGLAEYRKSFTSKQDAFNYFGLSLIFLVVAWTLRSHEVPGTGLSLGVVFLSSSIGFIVAMGGIVTVAQVLASEREDGTLLRAKGLPYGMSAYLLGKTFHIVLVTLTNTALVLVPALIVFPQFRFDAPALATLTWGLVLGLLATAPIGAVLGALIKNPRSALGVLMLPIMGISMVSGIFVPIGDMPAWGQTLAQVFPVYWAGLVTRSALLPDAMLAAEIGESWRHVETIAVLGGWALAGLILAPLLLRRMARRESGTSLAKSRERALANPL